MHELIQDMVDKHNLFDNVEILGFVPNDKLWDVLVWGHIFLNTSLTEAFCIANLEAAFAGLLVVTTNVGGIPEVLPPEMVLLCEPTSKAVLCRIYDAIDLADKK